VDQERIAGRVGGDEHGVVASYASGRAIDRQALHRISRKEQQAQPLHPDE
jgi:hypothetical protein